MKGLTMSAPMVRAFAEGRKTKTRRVIKELNQEPDAWHVRWELASGAFSFQYKHDPSIYKDIKSRFQVGDVVYIKEAWAVFGDTLDYVRNGDLSEEEGREYVIYKEGHSDWQGIIKDKRNGHPWAIKSPRFMPAWAARLYATITSVQAERLTLPLSDEELEAEGGEEALPILKKLNELWVWIYGLRKEA